MSRRQIQREDEQAVSLLRELAEHDQKAAEILDLLGCQLCRRIGHPLDEECLP
jgi:hypothetical protein